MKKIHKIGLTNKVSYQDGSFVAAGFVNGSVNPQNVLGVRGMDKDGNEVFWLDLSVDNALAIVEVLSGAIRKYEMITRQDKEAIEVPLEKQPES